MTPEINYEYRTAPSFTKDGLSEAESSDGMLDLS